MTTEATLIKRKHLIGGLFAASEDSSIGVRPVIMRSLSVSQMGGGGGWWGERERERAREKERERERENLSLVTPVDPFLSNSSIP